MPECLVVFASLNQVALLRRALFRRDVFVDMERTPQCLASTGCGFALRCHPSDLLAIDEECRGLSIVPGGTFQQDAHGTWIEYRSGARIAEPQ